VTWPGHSILGHRRRSRTWVGCRCPGSGDPRDTWFLRVEMGRMDRNGGASSCRKACSRCSRPDVPARSVQARISSVSRVPAKRRHDGYGKYGLAGCPEAGHARCQGGLLAGRQGFRFPGSCR
jgi:hypothetical protein